MACNLPGSSVHGILREEDWSVLPFPSSGDLPKAEIELSFIGPNLEIVLYVLLCLLKSSLTSHWRVCNCVCTHLYSSLCAARNTVKTQLKTHQMNH